MSERERGIERAGVLRLLAVVAAGFLCIVGQAAESGTALAQPADPGGNGRPSPEEPGLVVGEEGEILVSKIENEPVGPGVELTSFERLDDRGWLRGHVLEIDLSDESVEVDLLAPDRVTEARPLSETAKEQDAIAGTNGGFFDINNTNAPTHADVKDGELRTSPRGVTNAVSVGEDRLGRLAEVMLEGYVEFPDGASEEGLKLDVLNQPDVPQDGVGLYTPLWGEASRGGDAAGERQTREVFLRGGRVESVSEEAGSGGVPRDGAVLLGRGEGARALGGLSEGDRVEVSYAPKTDSSSPLEFAVNGNRRLVSDGAVLNVNDTTAEPRTSAGFAEGGEKMYLAVVDGRQSDSRGATLREMGELLAGFGSEEAINLDGGGSSTLLAREPGEEDAEVANSPSDGSERPVPNGVGLFAAESSGRLAGLEVEPEITRDEPAFSEETEEAGRIFPGLSRDFEAEGYDEAYAPAKEGRLSWRASPGSLGRFSPDGTFTARRSGVGEAIARGGRISGEGEISVLGALDRIETEPGRLGIEDVDSTSVFSVTGYDEGGYSAPIESRDADISYDESVIAIEETESGEFRVRPGVDEGSTVVEIRVGDETAFMPVTVGLDTEELSDFEDARDWTFSSARSSGELGLAEGRSGQGLEISYDFTQSTGTRAAYANAVQPVRIPGEPRRLGLWVEGDGEGAWLRTVVRDASGTSQTLDFARHVDWTGWRYVEAEVPDGARYPLELTRIYPVEPDGSRQYEGRLVFDDLTAEVTPPVETPETESVEDPTIIQNGGLGEDRFRFAVMADSQFVARDPDSDIVRDARRTLREIVDEDPEFLVVNGDFVDTGYREDFELARKILDEEVGERFPVYYVPGNHEIEGSGSIANFEEAFGENRRTCDVGGTRFILLDSSSGSLRSSDFEQLLDLERELETAAEDPAVKNVVVAAHHPTNDPLPTENSQLGDRKEADLMEDLLTGFRESSGNKGAVYIAGHAGAAHAESVDGVPYVVVPTSGKAPYAPPDDGGFTGWTMFGIDDERRNDPRESADEDWLRAEMRPALDKIKLDAPTSLAVGESAEVSATGVQPGGREFPLRYPATVEWSASENVFVGSGREAERASRNPRYAATFDPATGEITALGEGTAELRLQSNGEATEAEVRVGR